MQSSLISAALIFWGTFLGNTGDSKASPYLPTQVNDVGVWVVEGQQDPVAGVHLVKGYWLLHVFLEIRMHGMLIKTGKPSVHGGRV